METALGTLAQVFVGPLVGTISDYYGTAILEKIGIKWDVTEEMEKLSDILVTIQDVLEDAEDKQTTSKPVRRWLRKLKDVVYEVEDILDLCATEEAHHDPESTEIINGAAMVDRIKQLIDKFDKITEQRSKFNLINLSSKTRVVNYRVDPGRETASSLPTELKLYGRDEEKERIVNLMVNNINAGNLSIYAIVGIGGLGKTTLAQMVFHDNKVTSCFEIKRWVCVSENFEVKSIIGDIIQLQSNEVQTLDELQCRLQEKLSGKKFLLILDDVWNEDEAKWERLKSSLSWGAKGSSIIVTTRSDKVASLMGSSHDQVFHPKMLSEEDCFSLFKHRAFAEGEGEHHPNLESIGKEIVKKCGGVPLAAKALGGLLRFKREEKEWLFVKESKLWDLPQDKEDSIMPALWLSYKHLPQHLRQCFAYCSIFPKDYRMEKEVLIQLWMANGFLQPKGNMELEDIGNEVFNDLVWWGFFQEVSLDYLHNTVCKMHDLVHDLACSITRDECFSVVTDADKELVDGRLKTTRHFTITNRMLVSPNFSLSKIQSFLRTFLQLQNYTSYAGVVPLPLDFSNLIYLRVLDLRGTGVVDTELESIARLKLLRYLDLSGTRIAILSDEVFGNLINLQTLKLRECEKLEMLPGNMRKLTNLRYLDLSQTRIALLSDEVFGNLINLQTLKLRECEKLEMLPGNMRKLTNLRYLDLSRTDNAILSDEVFGNLINLQTLKLVDCRNLEMLPGNMRKLTNLRHLDITGSTGELLGMPVGMGQLKSLHKLSHFIVSEDSGCGVGELQELDHLGGSLGISWLWKVKDVRDAENAKLSRKENIRGLRLNWFETYVLWKDIRESQTNSMNDKLIADALQPHPNIKMLEFYNYGGSDFPSWMNSTCLCSLVTLHLSKCSKCKHLPTLGLLPRLKKLSLNCIGVECIGNEFYCDEEEEEEGNNMMNARGMVLFPALEKLELEEMPSLEEWKGWWSSSSRMKGGGGETQVSVFPVLKMLTIIDCPNLSAIPPLPMSLENLTIINCPQHLPPTLGLLPHLKRVSLRHVGVECIGNEFYCDMMMKTPGMVLLLFPALEELILSEMRSLEEWKGWSSSSMMEEGEAQVSVFPVLKTLRIKDCPNLSTIPPLPMSLKDVNISNCPALELLPDDFQNLVSLKDLHIEALPNFPEGILLQNSLKALTIVRCDGLKSLNNCLQLLTNLRSLAITNCPALELLPDDFQSLVSLKSLHLIDLPKLTAVPVLLGSTITWIYFGACAGLTNLPEWITNQKSLKSLALYECKNLKSLPEGLEHLTALRDLEIRGCHPELHRRCQENTGEDWHKIAHIPELKNFIDLSDWESD